MNSASYIKIFLTITLGFGIMHVGSLLVYLYTPQSYYHKPWAYFVDVALRVEGVPLRWEGMEYEDQTRKNLFLHQYGHMTTVTSDADGFRSSRFEAESYPIAFAGDSTIYGNQLSDDGTLPWKLAEAIEVPVFNGARATMPNLLAHPALADVQVVFDGITERSVFPRILKKWERLRDVTYEPLAKKDLNMLEAAGDVPPQRYSLPLMLLKLAERFSGDLQDWADGEKEEWRFLRHRMRPEELDETVALIVARKQQFDTLGIRYIFLPIPAKQNFYAEDVDDYTRNFLPTLVARLRAEGVEAVDLTTPFQAHKDEILFFPYDTHWNSKGTTIATEAIAKQVFGR